MVGVVDVGMRGGSSGVVGRHVWFVVVGVLWGFFRAVLLFFYTLRVSPGNS